MKGRVAGGVHFLHLVMTRFCKHELKTFLTLKTPNSLCSKICNLLLLINCKKLKGSALFFKKRFVLILLEFSAPLVLERGNLFPGWRMLIALQW